MTIKERLHQAVDTMTDEEARGALCTLAEASADPVAWTRDHAPLDDEPETDAERQAVAEARADRKRGGRPVPSTTCSPSSATRERRLLAHRRRRPCPQGSAQTRSTYAHYQPTEQEAEAVDRAFS